MSAEILNSSQESVNVCVKPMSVCVLVDIHEKNFGVILSLTTNFL
jgi:hypothetical protein